MKKGIFIVLLCFFILSGCKSKAEIKDLSIVDALGIDMEEDGTVNLTFQFYKAPSGDAKDEGKVEYYEASGETVRDALINAEILGNKKIYMSHNNIIIVGEETARMGFSKFTDAFERSRDIRENVIVVISDGKASEVMKTEKESNEGGQNESLKKMILNYKDNTKAYKITLLEICENLKNESRDFFVPIIKKGDSKKIKTEGIALFKEDKMVGKLSEGESFGIIFLRSKGTQGIVIVENPLGQEGEISLDFIKTKTKIKKENDKIKIQVQSSGRIWETTANIDFTDIKILEKLEEEFENKIKDMIKTAIEKATFSAGSDILGVKEKLNINDISKAVFEYDIKVNIVGYGLIADKAA
ncbi:MAG: Ger(x)C family spore germination protein [Clostridia bacterium]|nr:Ger(x)C family spore germination protein [Clostridia bacterium]